MTDKKQVMFDIERCIRHVPDTCRDCSHYYTGTVGFGCMENLMSDALALLKEQEAVEPLTYYDLFICPVCKNTLFREQKFCHECGKRIEWEGR